MVNEETKETTVKRLKKIEGQIRGLQQMIESGKYCIDILNQVNAARRALEQVALIIMKRHVESCVADSIKSKGGAEKIDEFIESVDRFIR